MPNCPVCGKWLDTAFGLAGHLRLKEDPQHREYRGGVSISRRHTRTSRRGRSHKVSRISKDLTVDDIERTVKRAMRVHQGDPATTPARQLLDQERQRISDLKNEQDLLVLLLKQIDGSILNDHNIIDGAPESIQRALWDHHLSLLC